MNQRHEIERRPLDTIQAKAIRARLNEHAQVKAEADRIHNELTRDVMDTFGLAAQNAWALDGDELVLYSPANTEVTDTSSDGEGGIEVEAAS